MSSVFRKDDNFANHPHRNTFDLSHQNNLTLKFGTLVPVLCQEVLPGDSFKIDPSFGLRYMPQKFPVQTRQRASIKYYYVRNRNLWKDWMDFIGKTKEGLTPPYLYFDGGEQYYLRPSSLADYMGIPVYIKGSNVHPDKTFTCGEPQVHGLDYTFIPNSNQLFSNEKDPFSMVTLRNVSKMLSVPRVNPVYANDVETKNYAMPMLYGGTSNNQLLPLSDYKKYDLQRYLALGMECPYVEFYLFRRPLTPEFPFVVRTTNFSNSNAGMYGMAIVRTESGTDVLMDVNNIGGVYGLDNASISYNTWHIDEETGESDFMLMTEQVVSIVGFVRASSVDPSRFPQPTFDMTGTKLLLANNEDLCWCDVSQAEIPFANHDNPDGIRINALPFRGIQAIYNALIRNAENNPLIIDGQPEYNKYILSDEGGKTKVWNLLTDYHTNWSDDRFTTALPSPQQGNAPLVGLTGTQGATVVLGNEDGTQSTVHLKVDGQTGNVMMVEGVSSDSPEYLNDAMMSAVEYGITINDLRNVNAFQKWLENNIRRGYKYKDQLMSHYGVNARFDVLDMPEFIGGVSRDVNVNQITQTVENEYGNLGDYAGQSSIMGEGHSISHYCDEHGFIIGLMTVYPVPLYQDTMPKHLLKQDAFDYYFPEFGKIGYQPITNKELCFSQSIIEGNADKTFGYQRAWYDYLERLDEVHGLFQTDLRNFIMARDFYNMPKLGADFLTIDHEDINNTFYSDDNKDKIIGQIFHKIIAKRPIPILGIPSIE